MSTGPTTPLQEHRRPISVRGVGVFVAMARGLARAGVTPNSISIAGMFAAIGAGACYAMTRWNPEWERVLFAAGAALIPVRLLCNMLDGMVAVEHGKKSATGEMYNEVPDRISDAAVLVGAGYAVESSSSLGLWAAMLALFVTWVRTLGKSMGMASDFRGPMAKQQRMWVMVVAGLFMAMAPGHWRFTVPVKDTILQRMTDVDEVGVMALWLTVVILGCIYTAARRMMRLGEYVQGGRVNE
jgi:phosphatidylglycerophosphate synthase